MSDYILCAQYDARIKIEQNQICHDQPPTINDGRRNSAASASRTLYDVPEAEVGSPAAPRHLVPSFCSIGTILPSRPARGPCRRAQRRSRMARLRATASAARSVLDGCEHDGMLSSRREPISKTHQSNHQKAGTKAHQKARSRLLKLVLRQFAQLSLRQIGAAALERHVLIMIGATGSVVRSGASP